MKHRALPTLVLFFLFNATSLHVLQNVQTPLLLSFLCMYVCVGGDMHTCGGAHTHLCACKQRPEVSALIPQESTTFFFFFETDSLTSPELVQQI